MKTKAVIYLGYLTILRISLSVNKCYQGGDDNDDFSNRRISELKVASNLFLLLIKQNQSEVVILINQLHTCNFLVIGMPIITIHEELAAMTL